MDRIDFETHPDRYRHWQLAFDGPVASLVMDVDPEGSLFPGCELKLNSYDLGVDIELADAVQRLRFEHPEVRCVVLRSGKDNVFCAGANIRMLGRASHGHKVNFCKFTNETRCAIEDASTGSGQHYLAAVSGACAGGGYELAATADRILLIDDRRSAVALPEMPLLAVLPGTGGLTRLTDKRGVRRDLADVFCSLEEGVRGRRAVEWRLVDEVVPPSRWADAVAARAQELAAMSDRPEGRAGHHADAARSDLRRGCRALPARPRGDRARRAPRHHHRLRPDILAGRPWRHSWRRGRVLAAGDGARTRRRHPASAAQ